VTRSSSGRRPLLSFLFGLGGILVGTARKALGLATITLVVGLPISGSPVLLPGLSVAWVAAGADYVIHLVVVFGGSLAAWRAIWAAVLTGQARRRSGITRPRRWLWLVGGAVAIGCALSLWFGSIAPHRAHRDWYDRVLADIRSLADRRPPDVTRGQWEYAVGWTNNLHGNCGSSRESVDREWRAEFAAELERRLGGPVTLADIEWIWDEYVAHTRLGGRYSDRYRPTRAEGFADVQPGCFGRPVE
jgi:hypothetical protein